MILLTVPVRIHRTMSIHESVETPAMETARLETVQRVEMLPLVPWRIEERRKS